MTDTSFDMTIGPPFVPLFPKIIGGGEHGKDAAEMARHIDRLTGFGFPSAQVASTSDGGVEITTEFYVSAKFAMLDRVFRVIMLTGTSDREVVDAVLDLAGLGDARCTSDRKVVRFDASTAE